MHTNYGKEAQFGWSITTLKYTDSTLGQNSVGEVQQKCGFEKKKEWHRRSKQRQGSYPF